MQALLEKHPEFVVKRYESGAVATNAECDMIYRQALERLRGREPLTASSYSFRADEALPTLSGSASPRPDISRLAAPQDPERQIFAGMKGNPVHVVVDEGRSILVILHSRPFFYSVEMDKVRPLLWAHRVLCLFPRFDHGRNNWCAKIDARSWGSQIYTHRPASQI